MSKKALFISDHGDPLAKLGGKQAGGQNNYVKQLALALENKGWQVDVATHWCDSSAPQIETFGTACRVVRLEAGHRGFVSKDEMYSMLPAFYEELKSAVSLESYDIVHTHYWLSGLIGKKLKKDFGLPYVHTAHSLAWAKEQATGVHDQRRINAEGAILRNADQVLATTNNEKQLIKTFVDSPSPIKVIPIGVDQAFKVRGNRTHLRRKFGYSNPLFVFAGRLEVTKGIFTLLKAFQLLAEKTGPSNTPHLVIAGGDAESIDLETKLPKDEKLLEAIKGIENRVEFLGPQSQDELALLFNSATATIVPSFYESFGMVAAEAQACGSPIIASDVGGLKNVVQDGITGLLVETKNEIDLAIAMEVLSANSLLTERLSRQAVQIARKDFDWDSISARINSLYEVIIGARSNAFVSNRFRRDTSR
ncbi:group 1 glycosyl transferase [Planococcus antarcticus DSM 14505]|uniref:Glycosyl transferase family 1 n=1 Tax=Planococcus antarcticus DSM 14505 TaxID=1185653 RepID=A0A1C7DBQ4_9BACL|nr:glycosyltransferase [Planococcus antarcticus]ANU08888.1 glycosyl transferase family 1 [Planococcus antarcticus DSM 14505]EIM06422.1 group 1 glycosyl transferase [Planococcus antarcticus DSM 14505]